MHIVDVSGTTNEKGEVAEGYDPINDIDWLDEEITTWVFNNLWSKWPGTQRRHIAAKNTAMQTFQVCKRACTGRDVRTRWLKLVACPGPIVRVRCQLGHDPQPCSTNGHQRAEQYRHMGGGEWWAFVCFGCPRFHW